MLELRDEAPQQGQLLLNTLPSQPEDNLDRQISDARVMA